MVGGKALLSSGRRVLVDASVGVDEGGGKEGSGRGPTAQEARASALAIIAATRIHFLRCVMSLLLLEALGALLLLVFIVWWTMFSGRKNGELKDMTDEKDAGLDKDEK